MFLNFKKTGNIDVSRPSHENRSQGRKKKRIRKRRIITTDSHGQVRDSWRNAEGNQDHSEHFFTNLKERKQEKEKVDG